MELGELKVFLAVASERSFSRAAAKLYRTQPAVSQAVRRLEEHLGERLFDRTTKQATLTEAGVVLFRDGMRLVQLAEEAAAAVRRQSERGRAILRIAGSEVAAHVVLPSISTFLKQHAATNVEFHRLAETHVVSEVAAGNFDIGVVTNERVPAQFQQLRIPMHAAGFSVIVPRTHRLAAQRSVPMSALRDERVITLSDANLPEAPPCLMGMPGIDSLKRAVQMGLGVGIVPSTVASTVAMHPGLVAVRLASAGAVSALTLVYRQNESLSKNTVLFIDVVRNSTNPAIAYGEASNVRRAAASI